MYWSDHFLVRLSHSWPHPYQPWVSSPSPPARLPAIFWSSERCFFYRDFHRMYFQCLIHVLPVLGWLLWTSVFQMMEGSNQKHHWVLVPYKMGSHYISCLVKWLKPKDKSCSPSPYDAWLQEWSGGAPGTGVRTSSLRKRKPCFSWFSVSCWHLACWDIDGAIEHLLSRGHRAILPTGQRLTWRKLFWVLCPDCFCKAAKWMIKSTKLARIFNVIQILSQVQKEEAVFACSMFLIWGH